MNPTFSDDRWLGSWEEAAKGPVAVVDCHEEIPCNPCEEACPTGAISLEPDICAIPRLDPRACNGCGRCVALCPGMAVFLLDRREGRGFARMTVPYEMAVVPRVGEEAMAVDGEGNVVGEGKIVKVTRRGGKSPTLLVTLRVPEEMALKVRGVRYRLYEREAYQEMDDLPALPDYPLCRCEDVSLEEVRSMLEAGFRSLSALRRASRAGLGYCQGMFCQQVLREELAKSIGRDPGTVGTFRVRPPVRPVKLGLLGGENA